ncbi:MAG: RNA-guided endonuclease TnpB family protein, partial [Xenococcus sp. (in: cyanobacteria)]
MVCLKLIEKKELPINQEFRTTEIKNGLATISYPKQALKLKGNQIRVPLGKTCKRWFALESFQIPMPSNLDFQDIKELRILPRNN